MLNLEQLDHTIAERRRYLQDIEYQINDTIERGNSELLALNYEVRLKRQELQQLKASVHQLERDKKIMQQDVLIIQESLASSGF